MKNKLAAAKYLVHREMPYFASALWGMTVILTEVKIRQIQNGIVVEYHTCAADRWGRLYIDPKAWEVIGCTCGGNLSCDKCQVGVQEWGGILVHELWHFLRDHAERMTLCCPESHMVGNLSTDEEINDDPFPTTSKLKLSGAILPSTFGHPDGLLAEEYVNLHRKNMQKCSTCGGSYIHMPGQSGQQQPGQPGQSGQSGQQQPGQPGQSGQQQPGQSGQSGQQQPGHNHPHCPECGSVDGEQIGHDCGSVADGHPRPWELTSPKGGMSRAEAEAIRRKVAQDLVEFHKKEGGKSRGTIPAGWLRWAKEKLDPQVPWQRELAGALQSCVAEVAGIFDYRYTKPSRRQDSLGWKVIFPSLKRPLPNVSVVVDTSGSMSDQDLAVCLAEVKGILKTLGMLSLTVIACDAYAHTCQMVFRVEQVKLLGGGGTDMGVGIETASRLRPRPDIIVVLTDGWTPWPANPPERIRVIAVIIGSDGSPNKPIGPAWARNIYIHN